MNKDLGLINLASRLLGAGVISANDDFFAEKENLLGENRAKFASHTFGHKGQIYDGWETRRRRTPGNDWAVIRLGAAGIIKNVVIDTGNFVGNFPESASVEATAIEGYPSPDLLESAHWEQILPKSTLKGDFENSFDVASTKRWTHVRLSIYPDGGVARFRAHGVVIPDPGWIIARGEVDLAAVENGSLFIGSSDDFYSSASNAMLPGVHQNQSQGWETRRRRGDGNDWFALNLGVEGNISAVEMDTTHFKGNAPGWISLSAGEEKNLSKNVGSIALISKVKVQPDTQHRFIVDNSSAVSSIRLDVYPDGGIGRLRVWGRPTKAGIKALTQQWWNSWPDQSEMKISAVIKDLLS